MPYWIVVSAYNLRLVLNLICSPCSPELQILLPKSEYSNYRPEAPRLARVPALSASDAGLHSGRTTVGSAGSG